MTLLCSLFGLLIGFCIGFYSGEHLGYYRNLRHERKRPVSVPIESID